MATRVKTIEFAWESLLTNFVTDSPIGGGTSTRADFAAVTLYVPESGVTFKSVVIEVTVRDQFSASTTWPQVLRLGIKLGAVAFSDVDYTSQGLASTGDHNTLKWSRDVTSYFVTNWTGTSMTSQVGLVVATTNPQNMGNISAKVYITYEYSDASSTHIKTIRIPIQGEHTTIGTSAVEIGTGGANAAAANQIPLLDTFLPETSKTIRQAWIEIVGVDGGAATTDFNAFYQIDSATEVTGQTLEQALTSSAGFKWISIYNTGTHVTSSAHAFKVRSSLASRFPMVSAILHVTYEFDPASTTILNSLFIPVQGQDSAGYLQGLLTAPGHDSYGFDLWVEEPSTITLKQSGLVLFGSIDSSSVTVNVWCGSQAERVYSHPNVVQTGGLTWVHRTDHGSGWTLARGKNRLTWNTYCSVSTRLSIGGGFAIVNYHSGRAIDGPGVHNQSTMWNIADPVLAGPVSSPNEIATSAQRAPPNFGAHYFLNNVGVHRRQTGSAPPSPVYRMQVLSGEFDAVGWVTAGRVMAGHTEVGCVESTFGFTSWFDESDQAAGKLDVETARLVRLEQNPGGGSPHDAARLWTTHHEIEFEVTGTVTGFTGDGSGIAIELWDQTDRKRVGTATTAVGGGYTVKCYDDTHTYYTEARTSSTLMGRSDDITPTAV